MTWSLRRRLTVAIVATVAIGFGVIAGALFVAVRHAAWQQHDRALASRARAIAAITEDEGGEFELALPPQPADEPAAYIEVWKPDGSVLLRSSTLGTRDLDRAFVGRGDVAFADLALPDGRAGRAVGLRFVARGDEDDPRAGNLVLVLADGTEAVDATTAQIRTVFVWLGGGALIVIALVTAWIVARGTRPLRRLGDEIARLDDRGLATPLDVGGGRPAELVPLVGKLNELFARLDAAFARERQFTADVSHELRTPLAGLRTLLEVTALEVRSPADYQRTLADALEIAKQLGAMVENLLALAQLDAGQVELRSEPVDLHALVEECWSLHAGTAAGRGLVFRNRLPAGTSVTSDREKLRIVIGNLLANAAEYTDPGGWIEVTAGGSLLEVRDSGPPIAADDLGHVFERLWRGDRARSGNGAHAGIGLALSSEICARLGFSLAAATAPDGAVTFRIDRADQSTAPMPMPQ